MSVKAHILRVLCFLTAMVLLGYAIYLAYQVTSWTTLGLMEAGWTHYLGRPSVTPVMFTFFCLSEGVCKQAYMQAWLRSYPLLVPCLTLIPLSMSALITVFGVGQEQKKSPGSARWARARDLQVLIKGEKGKEASPLRGYLGLTASGKMLRVPERLRNSHTLIVGGPGARKSTGYYKPNMLMDVKDKSSSIIIDLKYPDVKAGFFDMVRLYERAGFDVQLYLPFGDHTLCLPLLAGAETRQGAYEIAEMVVPGGSQEDAASFYRAQERQLMAGLVMGLARAGGGSLRRLYNLLMSGMSELQRYVREHRDPEVRRMLAAFFELENRVQAGIIAGLYGRLQVFDDDRLDRATTVSPYPWENIDLDALGVRPSLLYIGIPQEHLLGGRGQALLQLIKRTIDRAYSLLRAAQYDSILLLRAAQYDSILLAKLQQQLKTRLEGSVASWRRASQAQALWQLALFISAALAKGQPLQEVMAPFIAAVYG